MSAATTLSHAGDHEHAESVHEHGLEWRDPCYAIAQYPAFELAAHTRTIVDKLEAVEGGEIKRLMVFLPPRHGKSLLSTQIFPSWYLGEKPRPLRHQRKLLARPGRWLRAQGPQPRC
jgi:hypothetical protein